MKNSFSFKSLVLHAANYKIYSNRKINGLQHIGYYFKIKTKARYSLNSGLFYIHLRL